MYKIILENNPILDSKYRNKKFLILDWLDPYSISFFKKQKNKNKIYEFWKLINTHFSFLFLLFLKFPTLRFFRLFVFIFWVGGLLPPWSSLRFENIEEDKIVENEMISRQEKILTPSKNVMRIEIDGIFYFLFLKKIKA